MSFSPRQADVLICAGRLPFKLAPVIRRIWDQMPQPKWAISMGACASSGGIFDNYAMVQGIDTIIPVDVYVPGCPPRPEGLIYGIMLLQKKIKGESLTDEELRQEHLLRSDGLFIPRDADRRGLRAVRQLGPPDAVGMSLSRRRSPRSAPGSARPVVRTPGILRRHHRRGRRPAGPTRSWPGSRTIPTSSSTTSPTSPRWSIAIASGRSRWCTSCARWAGKPDLRIKVELDKRQPLAVGFGLRPLEGGRLAGARGVRHVRRELHRPSRSAPHPDVGDLRRRVSRCGRISRSGGTSAGPSRPARRWPPIPKRTIRWKNCRSPRRSMNCRPT